MVVFYLCWASERKITKIVHSVHNLSSASILRPGIDQRETAVIDGKTDLRLLKFMFVFIPLLSFGLEALRFSVFDPCIYTSIQNMFLPLLKMKMGICSNL